MGYRVNGHFRHVSRGEPKEMINFEFASTEWTSRRDGLPFTQIAGLEGALNMFGSTTEQPQP
jgi:hypothetical protein